MSYEVQKTAVKQLRLVTYLSIFANVLILVPVKFIVGFLTGSLSLACRRHPFGFRYDYRFRCSFGSLLRLEKTRPRPSLRPRQTRNARSSRDFVCSARRRPRYGLLRRSRYHQRHCQASPAISSLQPQFSLLPLKKVFIV